MHFRDENKLSIILYVDGNIVYFKSAQTSKSQQAENSNYLLLSLLHLFFFFLRGGIFVQERQ